MDRDMEIVRETVVEDWDCRAVAIRSHHGGEIVFEKNLFRFVIRDPSDPKPSEFRRIEAIRRIESNGFVVLDARFVNPVRTGSGQGIFYDLVEAFVASKKEFNYCRSPVRKVL